MRYTRQELKQDKFKETAADAVHWTVEHQKTITTVIIAAIVLIAIAAGIFFFNNYRNDKANAALGAAMQINNAPIVPKGQAPPQVLTYETLQDRATAAKKAFYDVSSQYGSTRAGKLAKYMAGQAEVDLGSTKAAEDDFKAVAESSDSSVSSLAKFALASVYRESNRESDAINVYNDLIAHPTDTVPKTTAQLELADLYSTKQPEEAKKIYAQIQKDDSKSVAAQIANQRLSTMK